jgi:hypothetical protein
MKIKISYGWCVIWILIVILLYDAITHQPSLTFLYVMWKLTISFTLGFIWYSYFKETE